MSPVGVRHVAFLLGEMQNDPRSAALAREYLQLFLKLGCRIKVLHEKLDISSGLWPPSSQNLQYIQLRKNPLFGPFRDRFFRKNINSQLQKDKLDLTLSFGAQTKHDVLVLSHLPHLENEWVRGSTLPKEDSQGQKLNQLLQDGTNQLLVVSSQLMKKDLQERFHIDSQKIEIQYPSYSRDKFNTREKTKLRSLARAEWQIPETEIIIGFATTKDFKAAGLDYALNVFWQLVASRRDGPALRLIVLGDAQQAIDFQKMTESLNLGDKVRVVPPPAQMEAFYHGIDMLFLPARLEEFGQHVLEAMACGLPVLASNHVGASELLQSKQLVKNPDDEKGWTEAFNELLQNKEWRKAIARQNSERAPLLDENRSGMRLLDTLRKHNLWPQD